jgi:hypothetical protein
MVSVQSYVPTFCPINWEEGYRKFGHGSFRANLANYEEKMKLTEQLQILH